MGWKSVERNGEQELTITEHLLAPGPVLGNFHPQWAFVVLAACPAPFGYAAS